MTAEEYYQQGNAARKQGHSPAVEAKRMLDDIYAFYCKDMYNP